VLLYSSFSICASKYETNPDFQWFISDIKKPFSLKLDASGLRLKQFHFCKIWKADWAYFCYKSVKRGCWWFQTVVLSQL